jgi:phage-related tail protein
MVLGRILTQDSKKDEFISKCLTGVSDINEPYSLENKFRKIVNDLANDYSKEINRDEESFQEFKKENEYKNYVDGVEELMYKAGKVRKFTFSTVTPSTEEVKEKFQQLYDGENHGEVDTYLGKVKLTS